MVDLQFYHLLLKYVLTIYIKVSKEPSVHESDSHLTELFSNLFVRHWVDSENVTDLSFTESPEFPF